MIARHEVFLIHDEDRPYSDTGGCRSRECRWSWDGVGSYEWAKTNHEKLNDQPEYPPGPELPLSAQLLVLSRAAALTADECWRRGDRKGQDYARGLRDGLARAAEVALAHNGGQEMRRDG